MAQFDMPEAPTPPRNVPVDYNNLPKPVVNYDTSGKSVKKSELSLWWEGIWRSLSRDILVPTLRKMTYDMFTRGLSMVIFKENYPGQGGPAPYGGYTPYSGFSGNANYNPGAYGNPFNAVDPGIMYGYGGQSTPLGSESWRNPGFATGQKRAEVLDQAKQWLYTRKRLTVYEFATMCGQKDADWALNNWGWKDLSMVRERYNAFPKHAYIDIGNGKVEKIAIPFELIMPDPISLV